MFYFAKSILIPVVSTMTSIKERQRLQWQRPYTDWY